MGWTLKKRFWRLTECSDIKALWKHRGILQRECHMVTATQLSSQELPTVWNRWHRATIRSTEPNKKWQSGELTSVSVSPSSYFLDKQTYNTWKAPRPCVAYKHSLNISYCYYCNINNPCRMQLLYQRSSDITAHSSHHLVPHSHSSICSTVSCCTLTSPWRIIHTSESLVPISCCPQTPNHSFCSPWS